jgi:RNA polymerase sigma factor (sigma-70 family)
MIEDTSGAQAQDVQTAYINDLRRVLKPLTAAQRRELYKLMTDSEQGLRTRALARAELWEDATRLVLAVEGRIRKRYGHEDADMDMIQEGNLAAGKAVDSWNPDKGAFSTWIVSNVRGAMLDYLNESNKGGVGSKSSDAVMMDMEEGVAYAAETTGTTDTPGAKTEGAITRGELLTYDGIRIGEDLEGTSAYAPHGFESQETQYETGRLEAALTHLPDRDAYILSAYYGIGLPQLTLQQIADKSGYSVSGIRKRITLSKKKVQELLQHSTLRVREHD